MSTASHPQSPALHADDPGDCPAPDLEAIAAGKVLSTLEFVNEDCPFIVLDDECDFQVDGEYVWIDVPIRKIRVRRQQWAETMAAEVLEELSILTHVAEAMKPTPFRTVGE